MKPEGLRRHLSSTCVSAIFATAPRSSGGTRPLPCLVASNAATASDSHAIDSPQPSPMAPPTLPPVLPPPNAWDDLPSTMPPALSSPKVAHLTPPSPNPLPALLPASAPPHAPPSLPPSLLLCANWQGTATPRPLVELAPPVSGSVMPSRLSVVEAPCFSNHCARSSCLAPRAKSMGLSAHCRLDEEGGRREGDGSDQVIGFGGRMKSWFLAIQRSYF
jgi:hypothetical protein